MVYTRESSVGQVLRHPVARDLIDKMLLITGKSRGVVYNPAVRFMRLAAVDAIALQAGYGGFVDVLLSLINDASDVHVPAPVEPYHSWWREAVVYQIYPRSFQDSNGDGYGDLQGIRSRLDYLQALGVNALWLSPIFDSPQVDNGYDVRDYRAIDAKYGTMEDFEQLVADVHRRGMKLILDMVLNHSSDQHEWFQSSLKDPESPYRDYYYWKEGTPGRPPNNWQSFFGGSAWKYYEERGAWNLHLFAPEQPDLNWENPYLRASLYEVVRFWREKGVDGFRLDAINYISKVTLSDGHPALGKLLGPVGMEHYFYGSKLHEYLKELRQNGLGDAYAVGEASGIGREMGRLLTAPGRQELDEVFYFDHLEYPKTNGQKDGFYNLYFAKKWFTEFQETTSGELWDALFWENHDTPRMISKVNQNPSMRVPLGKLLNLWLLTLRGTPYLYQGEELGLPNVDFQSIEEINDIETRNVYFKTVSEKGEQAALDLMLSSTRDHARAPMPWKPYGGFSTGKPWLREHDDLKRLCVDAQEEDEESVLGFTRRAIALRKHNPALLQGTFEALSEQNKEVFCFTRTLGKETLYMEFNLTPKFMTPPKRPKRSALLLGSYGGLVPRLRPYEGNVYLLEE